MNEVIAVEAFARGELVHVFFEERFEPIGHALDQGSEEDDVAAGAEGRIDRCQRRGAGEARIDVDHLSRVLQARLGFDHPPERDRVAFGHVRTHDEHAVRRT